MRRGDQVGSSVFPDRDRSPEWEWSAYDPGAVPTTSKATDRRCLKRLAGGVTVPLTPREHRAYSERPGVVEIGQCRREPPGAIGDLSEVNRKVLWRSSRPLSEPPERP